MPYSEQQYQKAKATLADPNLDLGLKMERQRKVAEFEDAQDRGFQTASIAATEAPKLATPPVADAGKSQGFDIDLSRPNVIKPLGMDPRQAEVAAKFRAATEDTKLPNASKLKVFSEPPDYRPQGAIKNPFSALPAPPKDTQYFYEPSLDEFKEAVKGGALGAQLQREFPGVPDPLKLIDKDLQGSKAFRAYQDAAWKHALADAMRTNTPISRVEYSKDVGTIEKLSAKALDPAVSFATGALSGYSAGTADPLIRSVAPEAAEAERRSRMRNPTVALGGELAGALSPRGLPARAAGVTSRLLGGVGLGSKGLQGVTKGVLAAGATGALDANVRAVAQSAADALDAGDSAVEALHRLSGILSPEQVAQRTLEGGAMGMAMGAGGEALGGLAGKGARAIVGNERLKPVLTRGLESGVKMSPSGEPVMTPQMETAVTRAQSKRTTADDILATEARDPILSTRLKEQEGAIRKGQAETQQAQERLKAATVPTQGIADQIMEFAESMPGLTQQAQRKKTALQRYGRMLRDRQNLTAKEFDSVISEADAQANFEGNKTDPDWKKVSAILKSGRDEFQFEDPTRVDNYAIRDPEGNAKGVSGYSGLKTKHNKQLLLNEFDNRLVGLPKTLKSEPVSIPDAPDDVSLQALAEGAPPKVKLTADETQGFQNVLRSVAEPDNLARTNKVMEMAERAGVSDKLRLIQKLRDAQDWKQLLGRVIEGIGVSKGGSAGGYVKANQLLRAVPTLKSISGGLPNPGGKPPTEATDKAVQLVDKFLAEAVPEGKALNVRSGQGARASGALKRKDKGIRDTMTDEEAQFALTVIRNVLDMEGNND